MNKDHTWTGIRIRVSLDKKLEEYLQKYPHLGNKSTFVANTLLKEMRL